MKGIKRYLRHIEMTRGERYILLRVTNDEWWDVIHFDFRTRNDKKFYVPAKYVKPLNLVVSEKDCDHEGKPYLGWFP